MAEESAAEKAQAAEQEQDEAKEEMHELEQADELPGDTAEWPDGAAKYETFGKDDAAYGDGVTEKLGPANLERHADGSVSIDGEKVDNPEDYKGEPIVAAVAGMDDDDREDEQP